jgi:choice-of-anchor B domain-containing protein
VIVIWDVANPAAPARLATVVSTGGIAHEAYVKNNILYGAYMQLTPTTIPELMVVNVANPAAPVVLARVNYPNAALVHSATATPDGRYVYVADEVTNAPIRIFDMANPAAPALVGTYQPRFGTVPHHFVVRDDIAYLSMYKNGVEVVDVSDPTRPRLVGFYDTHPGQATDGSTAIPPDNVDLYRGAWGVHWTDDGKIVVSDMDAGVFVLRFQE